MAKKKASTSRSSKKTTKKTGSSRSTSAARAKKTSSARVTKKKPAARKTTKKKKKTTKKTKTSAGSTPTKSKSPRKTTSRAATSKKVSTGGKTTSKKKASSSKKKASSSAPASKKKATSKAAAAGTAADSKKTGKKKTTRKPRARSEGGTKGNTKIKGRSVAEVASAAETDDQGYVVINGRRVRMISLKGVDRTKKKKPTRVAAQEAAPAELPARLRKTKLPKKDIKYFTQLLLERRREIVGNLGSMENEALRPNSGEISHMPIHMADIGSDTYEQDFLLGLAETERQRLKEIDAALRRVAEGTYGVCMKTGAEIPRARLEAKPWARYTIEAAREMELTGYSS